MKKQIVFIIILSILIAVLASACSSEPEEPNVLPSQNEVVLEPIVSSSSSESEAESSSMSSSSEESVESSSSSSETQEESSVSSSSMPEEETLENGYSTLILVNPWNYIPEDYTVELVNVQGKYNLDAKAAQSAIELLAAAKKAGYNMVLCSAYRTVEKSAELYNRKVKEFINAGYDEENAKIQAARWVAPPGTSEHHTGLAMDLVSSDYWGYYSDLEHDYENFDSFKWMYKHCAEFGFILRYPKDKQDITGITYEPWHSRYVGKEAAEYIMANGLCLEEYLDEIK